MNSSLTKAAHLLESYRVVLLQRPAMLYPVSILDDLAHANHERATDSFASNQNLLLPMIQGFVSGGKPLSISSDTLSIQSLCAISLLASHSRRLPGSLPRRLDSTGSKSHSSQGWRPEFFELALQKWLCSHTIQPLPGTLLLYHTIFLSTYSDFAQIGRSAHLALGKKASGTSSGATTAVPLDPGQRPESPLQTPSLEDCFTSEGDQEKAIWHANKILRISQDIEVKIHRPHGERVHLLQQAEKAGTGDPTHYSYAVYYATMVLWWSQKYSSPSSLEILLGNDHLIPAKQVLRKGIDLLSRSESQVAGVFKHILVSLES